MALSLPAKPIRLRTQAIDPGASAQPGVERERGLFLVQFRGPVQPEWRDQLAGVGATLLRYVPEDAFVVRFDRAGPGLVRALPFVQWVGPYRPEHKVHPLVARRGDSPDVSILLAPGAAPNDLAAAKNAFRRLQQESRSRFGAILRGQLAPGQLRRLADSDSVLWIEPAPQIKLFDETSCDIVAGPGSAHTTTIHERGYDGANVTVAVADSGLNTGTIVGMHPDLAGRVVAFYHSDGLDDASDEHSHGTHVAGIVAGDGTVGEVDDLNSLYGLGVAPGANIVAQRIFDGLGAYFPPSSFGDLTSHAVNNGADIGSNSWGEDTHGRYDLSAAEFDGLVRDADVLTPGDQQYILEFSAGNAGPGFQTIGSPAVGKNVIATGAAQNNRFDFFIYAEGQEAMADFSSRGPCEDGRIKPDLVAPGTWIASLRSELANDDNAWASISPFYMYQGGTSQAGPHVSGAAAVFVQYYTENYGAKPSPALVKAALINSAVDMDDSIETAPAPNNDEGWGRLDLTELIGSAKTYDFVDQSVLLTSGQVHERRLIVASSDAPLKITLTYTDVPGFPGALPALVNDLDLEVTAPDGTAYRGNQFDEGESIPNAGGRDAINNVEGVHLFEPTPGEYIVRVRGRNVVEDARIDSPAIDQDFALVISANVLPPGVGAIFFDRTAYTAPGRIRITVIDTDLAGTPTVTASLRSTAEPSGELIVLRAAGNSGIFTNAVATITGTATADDQLQIAHGNLIEAFYNDVSAGVTRSATATADLVPPVISDVSITNRFGRAQISWETDERSDSRVLFGTNTSLGQIVSDSFLDFDHVLSLEDLVPGATYFFKVASSDRAGNGATNDNGGALYRFVAPTAPAVLVVDGFFGDLFFDPPPPIENYTSVLDQIGVDYDVWNVEADDSPTLADLRPYQTVVWRLAEIGLSRPTFTQAEQTALVEYLAGGGSLFVASMEVLTRLGEVGAAAFRQNVLQVSAFEEDVTVPSVSGIGGDPITGGMDFALDYSEYTFFEEQYDFSDVFTPSTNAAPIFQDSFGDFAGLRYPRSGFDSPGRVVFLSFPFDTLPAEGAAPNTRAEFLRRVLAFLAPGSQGMGSLSLDKGFYTLPAIVTVEVADSDLVAASEVTVTASNSRTGASMPVTLQQTTRRGTLRGTFALVATAAAGALAAQADDVISVTYFDASRAQNVTDTAIVDTQAPSISSVAHEPNFVDAVITWETSEPADSLVQYGESPLLERTAYQAELTSSHEAQLLGLLPDQTYYYRVVSRDEAGNAVVKDNNGVPYSFRTLHPLVPPWTDNFDDGAADWTVIDGEETYSTWTLGVPSNGWESAAVSPPNAWGSNLDGAPLDYAETFLVSPAVHLVGGNRATLRFWHSYDFTEKSEFDIIELGRVLLITNVLTEAIELASFEFDAAGWEEVEIDLTPHVGHLVYLVFHYVVFSLDAPPRAGWLVDDVSIAMNTITPGVVVATNNLFQAKFTITGPYNRSAGGMSYAISNAPPGNYTINYGAVPFYQTPPSQSLALNSGATITFTGNYTFADANRNGMSDVWETNFFGNVSPGRTATTDTDRDGVTDLKEFLSGTNPNSAESQFEVSAATLLPDGRLRTQWLTTPGRAYCLEGSTNGITWAPVTPWRIAPGNLMSHDVPPWSSGAPYLFRIVVLP